ncbi:unnamed protein product [Dovyalis caffra]|uniref:Uncharacterized protein n=1 Tax=Dovyalis caffra TaxID=77055 RepID=A0AAV1S422_9ROSI|nr:unnamed protein product [Dovyalis caffra]
MALVPAVFVRSMEQLIEGEYRFHVLLNENNLFGMLGKSGRGLTEYHAVPIEKIDIVTADMGHVLATEGGFCTGSARVVDHQEAYAPFPGEAIKFRRKKYLILGLSNIQGLSTASDPESPIKGKDSQTELDLFSPADREKAILDSFSKSEPELVCFHYNHTLLVRSWTYSGP